MTDKTDKRKYSLITVVLLVMTYNCFAQDNKVFTKVEVLKSEVNQENIRPFIYRGQSVFLIDTLIEYSTIVLPEPIADGRYIAFHDKDTSKIAYDYEFKNRKQNGHAFKFYKSGQIEDKSNYSEGGLDGIQYFYFENGQPSTVCSFANGRLNGKYECWYSDGKKKCEEEYKNGRRIHLKRWDENGNLVRDEDYKSPHDK